VVRIPGQKEVGAYYTPDVVVQSLLRWAVRHDSDRLLDPSCGDGRFVAGHRNAVGIEQDLDAAHLAMKRAQPAQIYENDFFSWASETSDRFDCAAGNPPFIRYQTFTGDTRRTALRLCSRLGADFSKLTSSWAPFLVATAGLLKRGGRMAFVVPAEIAHAAYSAPLLEFLVANFDVVHVLAVRERLFPALSEDCWLLYLEGFGGRTDEIRLTAFDKFKMLTRPPRQFTPISVEEWRTIWNRRLRPYLMPKAALAIYEELTARTDTRRFGDIASIGIGYVTGANDFFHLRPSQAERFGIPGQFLHPSVRNGRALSNSRLTNLAVEEWKRKDKPILLLRLPKLRELPQAIWQYLDSDEGYIARVTYKCRTRDPWYSVPDVKIPDFFLTYMSGVQPNLVRNEAGCTCTNSVHSVRLKPGAAVDALRVWGSDFVQLSCEVQGHPLGGGMLKIEPREAMRIALPTPALLKQVNRSVLHEAIGVMREWRHYASAA
jgi:adenine-specific DNA-methyltransferase